MGINWNADQLDAIYQKNKNIIISAGAGSGKSTVLSERIKQKLLAKEISSLDDVLVLTFTTASAADLKRKIKEDLTDCEQTKMFARTVDSANISTFDSYALLLVKKYANEIGINKDISIVESTVINIKKREIIENILEKEYEKQDKDFVDFVSNFFVKGDLSFKNYLLKIYEKINLRLDKKEYLSTYLDVYFNDAFFDNIFTIIEKYLLKKHNDCINYYNDTLIPNINGKLKDGIFEEFEENYSNFINSKSYDDLFLLFKDKFSHYKLHQKTAKGVVYNEEIKPFIDSFKELFDEIESFFKEYDDYNSEKSYYYSTEKYLKIILRILTKFDEELEKYKEDLAIYEFCDIAKKLIYLLRDNPSIRDEVANNYKEILIDEYQDTSDLQEAFVSLISNKNVYMVGDIKQSIYRFRNANPSIFKYKYDNYLDKENYETFANSLNNNQNKDEILNGKGIKIDLKANYRSRKDVVEFINKIFNKVMSDSIGGAKYKEEHQMVYGQKRYDLSNDSDYKAEILKYEYNKEAELSREETETRIMAKDILDKVSNGFKLFKKYKNEDGEEVITSRPATFKDFAIISRSTDNYELIAKIFKEYGIDTLIYKNERINASSLIYTLKNILILIVKLYQILTSDPNGIIDTEFKHAFISVARSFIFEYSDDQILEVFAKNKFFDDNIILLIKDSVLDLSNDSLRNIFEKVLYKYDYYNKITKLDDINDNLVRTEFFAKLCDNLEILNLKSNELIEYLETMMSKDSKAEISSNMKDINAVTVMTIHKSKGLEFPIVYVPFLYKEFNDMDLKARFVYDENYGIITPCYNEGFKNVLTKELFKINYKIDAISEEIRIFYVALTRAKEKLILVYDGQIDNTIDISKINSYKKLVSAVGDSLNKYIIDYDVSNLEPSQNKNFLTSIPEKNKEKIREIFYAEQEIKGEKTSSSRASKSSNKLITKKEYNNMQLGTHIHELLEYIDYDNPNEILKDEENWIKHSINKFLNTFIFKNKEENEYYREYAFTFEDSKDKTTYNGIIDLLVETPDNIYIVDYKLNNVEDDAYIKQLSIYEKFVATKSNKPITTYLYSIIDGSFKEIKTKEIV